MQISIPCEVKEILLRLKASGFEAYAVGGCVRDSILGRQPNDWDICTGARAEQTAAIFPHTVLTGAKYGTVTVIENGVAYEITTFRSESGYEDHRHPSQINFLDDLAGDLARRDFSINAMAADADGNVIDLFDGLHDLRHGFIRAVGDANERFTEDALRILRALRFAARFDFTIEPQTARAIHALAPTLKNVANERLSKELRLICDKGAAQILREFADVFTVIVPELAACIGFKQYNYHHEYDVWEHTLHALQADESRDFVLRLAILLHDIGKPCVFTMDKNAVGHFYGHAIVGSFMAETILRRLRFDNATVEAVTQLVRLHDYHLNDMTKRSMRRFLAKYGETTLQRLILLRCADRSGKGTDKKIEAFKEFMQELLESCRQTAAPLQLSGRDLMALGVPQGTQIGYILRTLQEAVFDDRVENEHEKLVSYAQQLLQSQKID